MIRLTWLPDGPYVISDPVRVVRHYELDGKPVSVEHMASTVERRATEADVEQWRMQR